MEVGYAVAAGGGQQRAEVLKKARAHVRNTIPANLSSSFRFQLAFLDALCYVVNRKRIERECRHRIVRVMPRTLVPP